MNTNQSVSVPVPKNIAELIAERDAIINRNVFKRGDGDRLYQIQVRLSQHFCESYARAVQ